MNVVCIPTGPLDVNTYVVYDEGPAAFIVDPACCEFCSDQSVVANFLKKNNLTCCAIVLTHGHFDHVAGISYLKNIYTFAPVLISKRDSKYIGPECESVQSALLEPMEMDNFLPSVSNLCEPDGFLNDGFNLYECSLPFFESTGALDLGLPCSTADVTISAEKLKELLEEWTVISTPGHSAGSVCLYNKKEDLLFSGDTLFFKSHGRSDLPEGDEAQLLESIEKLKKEIPESATVYPGHDAAGFPFFEGLE